MGFLFSIVPIRVRMSARYIIQIRYFLLFTFFIRLRVESKITTYRDKYHDLGDKVLRMSKKSSTFAPDLRKPLKTRSIGTILLIRKVECASYFCRCFVELLSSFYRAFAEFLPSFCRVFTEFSHE